MLRNRTMLITCPHCATSYEVAAAMLGAQGRSVRCVRCRTVWTVQSQDLPESAFASDAASGERLPQADGAFEPARAMQPFTFEAEMPPVGDAPPGESLESAVAPETMPADLDDRGPIDILQSPPLIPPEAPEPQAAPSEPIVERPFIHGGHDLDQVVQRRAKRMLTRKKNRFADFMMPATIFCLLTIIAGLLLWRKEVVRLAPQTASLYAAIGLKVNLRELRLTNVKTSIDDQDAVPVLIVEGQIVGEGRLPVEVPRLRFAIRNAAGYEIYTWTALASRMVLGHGEATNFRTRLASPPPDGREVIVRFFNRRDLLTGNR